MDTARGWSGAVRGSFVTDANIRDFTIFSTGLDATVSRTFFVMLTPYAGGGMNWNHGHIVSNEVNLANENSLGFRGLAGLDFRCKFVTLGYEMQFGDGRANRSFNLGVLF